ncbi:MAG: hypothetical protein HY433_00540 [Candidatus Liptonbacteria bacterium]|nr:hypothetical protein [Candidatus Liptonbacteria bacterium]
MSSKKFIFQDKKIKIDSDTTKILDDFFDTIPTLEKELEKTLLVLFDSKTKVFYTLCNIKKKNFVGLVDKNAVIDPDLQEDYKLNRDLQPNNPDFKEMQNDASKGRQFTDIVVEYNKQYKPDRPLKILGGQHRAEAIEQKSPDESVHGLRIYFNLDKDKRAEIAIISNTNIDISPDLLDRMEEQRLDPPNKLRDFAYAIGLLEKGKDFADSRVNPNNLPTVRMARTFIVNFYKGREYEEDYDSDALEGMICSSSGMDSDYEKIYKIKNFAEDEKLVGAGKKFIELHKKQYKIASNREGLKQVKAHRMKAMAIAVVSAWSYVSGLLQRDSKRLSKFYDLPKNSGKNDPLNAKAMTAFQLKGVDPEAYRGLGTRTDAKERGRLITIFLEYSKAASGDEINPTLLDRAVRYYQGNKMRKEGDKYK